MVSANSLLGPKNDIPAFLHLLVEKYGFQPENIEVLQDQRATKSNIVTAFERRLITPVSAGDLALFYYSGHDTQVKDWDGDEQDGLDEAFLPYDGTSMRTLLLDDDLASLAGRIPTREVVVIIDACHSGTGTRGMVRARRMSAKALGIEDEPATRALAVVGANSAGAAAAGALAMSAAQPGQIAADFPFLNQAASGSGNPYMGAFTYYLLQALRADAENQLTYEALTQLVGAALGSHGLEQVPVLEGSRETPFLMLPDAGVSLPAALTNGHPTPGTASVEVAAVRHGELTMTAQDGVEMTPGSIYESERDSTTVVRVLATNGQTAIGNLVNGQARPGDKLVETFHFIPQSKLRVVLLADSVLTPPLRRYLQNLDFVEMVRSDEFRDLDLECRRGSADSLVITPYRNQQRLPAIPARDTSDAMAGIRPVLENLYAVKQFIDLKNPNPPFNLDVQVDGKDYAEVHIGDAVTFTVKVDRDAYLYLVDVDPAGKVTVLFPNKYAPNNDLKADSTYQMPAPKLYRLEAAGPAGPELVKAIATTKPLSLEVLAADAGDFSGLEGSAVDVARTIVNQLKREVNRVASRGIVVLPAAPDEQPIATKRWASDECCCGFWRNSVRIPD